jgi:hypothetical protein
VHSCVDDSHSDKTLPVEFQNLYHTHITHRTEFSHKLLSAFANQ